MAKKAGKKLPKKQIAKKTEKKSEKKSGKKGRRAFSKGSLKQIGVLTLAQSDDTEEFAILRTRLRDDLKNVEGKDFSLHFRFANGDNSKLSALATELLQIPVEAIVTGGTRALKELLALNPPANLKIIQVVGGENPAGSNQTGFYLDVVSMCTDQVAELKKEKITNLTILHDSSSHNKNVVDPYAPIIKAAADLDIKTIDVSGFADLQKQLTPSTVFDGPDDVVGGFMLIANGWFFDHYPTIAQIVDAAMQTKTKTWAIYPELEFKSVHSKSTKDRVIVSGRDVAKAYKDTADHIDDVLKNKAMRPSKPAGKIHDP